MFENQISGIEADN